MIFDELVQFLRESAPDELSVLAFGELMVAENSEEVSLWDYDDLPADLEISGLFVRNKMSGYYETILVSVSGKIAYLPEIHPNDRVHGIFSDLYGLPVYQNLEEFKASQE